MGIVRVGIDLSEVEQVAESISRFGDRYTERIFTAEETSQCREGGVLSPAGLALRFAAKEAVVKALSPEMGEFPGWTSIEITRCPNGLAVQLEGEAALLADRAGIDRWALATALQGQVASAMAFGICLSEKFQSKREMVDTETGQKAESWRPDD